jgi:hypothetical protein
MGNTAPALFLGRIHVTSLDPSPPAPFQHTFPPQANSSISVHGRIPNPPQSIGPPYKGMSAGHKNNGALTKGGAMGGSTGPSRRACRRPETSNPEEREGPPDDLCPRRGEPPAPQREHVLLTYVRARELRKDALVCASADAQETGEGMRPAAHTASERAEEKQPM